MKRLNSGGFALACAILLVVPSSSNGAVTLKKAPLSCNVQKIGRLPLIGCVVVSQKITINDVSFDDPISGKPCLSLADEVEAADIVKAETISQLPEQQRDRIYGLINELQRARSNVNSVIEAHDSINDMMPKIQSSESERELSMMRAYLSDVRGSYVYGDSFAFFAYNCPFMAEYAFDIDGDLWTYRIRN